MFLKGVVALKQIPKEVLSSLRKKYNDIGFAEIDEKTKLKVHRKALEECLDAFSLVNPDIEFYPVVGEKYSRRFLSLVAVSAKQEELNLPQYTRREYGVHINERGLSFTPKRRSNRDIKPFFLKVVYA